MKTSLSHLPESKQQEIRRIAEIIREVVNPEMIIFFRSHTRAGSAYKYNLETPNSYFE
jgi:hypothetical protein